MNVRAVSSPARRPLIPMVASEANLMVRMSQVTLTVTGDPTVASGRK